MKKKWIAILTMAVIIAGLLSACGSKSASDSANAGSGTDVSSQGAGAKEADNAGSTGDAAKEPVTIKFVGWEKPAVYQAAISDFESKNPDIKVEYQAMVENDSNASLKKIELLYATGDDFDVFPLNGGTAFEQMASNGMLEPLDGYLDKEGVKYENEYSAEQMKYDGKRYSLPGKFGPWLVLLNKDMLDKANLPVPTSWTWDDFMDYAKKLTQGDGPQKIFGAHFHTWKDYFLLRMYSQPENQGLMKDDGSALNVDNPLLKQSLLLDNQMMNVDKTVMHYRDVVTQNVPYRNQFFGGKAAMLPTGPWMITEAGGTDQIPATFTTAFAPWPKNNADDLNYSYGGADPLVISAHSRHKEEAYKFLRYLSTEGMILTGQLSSWKKADLTNEVNQIVDATKSPDKIDKASLMNVLKVTNLPKPGVPIAYQSDLEKAFISDVEKYLLGNKDIDATMAAIQNDLQKVVDANKK